MKFISKSANLLIVLSPGLQAQPLTGMPAKPTVSVRFKDGVAEVQQQELIDMMLRHPAFNGDFISADNVKEDPYSDTRRESEPAHILQEMKYGTPVSRQVVGGDSAFSSLPLESQKMIKSLASEMAKAMIPSMLQELVSAHEASKVDTSGPKATGVTKAGKPKKRPGRKAKKMVAQSVPETVENPTTQESVS